MASVLSSGFDMGELGWYMQGSHYMHPITRTTHPCNPNHSTTRPLYPTLSDLLRDVFKDTPLGEGDGAIIAEALDRYGHHPPLAANHPPATINYQAPATRHPPSATRHPPPATLHPPPATSLEEQEILFMNKSNGKLTFKQSQCSEEAYKLIPLDACRVYHRTIAAALEQTIHGEGAVGLLNDEHEKKLDAMLEQAMDAMWKVNRD